MNSMSSPKQLFERQYPHMKSFDKGTMVKFAEACVAQEIARTRRYLQKLAWSSEDIVAWESAHYFPPPEPVTQAAPVSPLPSELAKKFHEIYERLAPEFGYETRKASAKPWSEVPENNRHLVMAVCSEILQIYRVTLTPPKAD